MFNQPMLDDNKKVEIIKIIYEAKTQINLIHFLACSHVLLTPFEVLIQLLPAF